MPDLEIRVPEDKVSYVREMVRQQLLGDRELLQDALAGREDPSVRLEVAARLRYIADIADMLELPSNPDRRRRRMRPWSGRAQPVWSMPFDWSTSVIAVALVLVTAAGYLWSMKFGPMGSIAFYAPVMGAAAARHGLRAGVLTAVASLALWDFVIWGNDAPVERLVLYGAAALVMSVLVAVEHPAQAGRRTALRAGRRALGRSSIS